MDRPNGQVPTGTYHQTTESFWTVYDQDQRGGPKLGAKVQRKKRKGDSFRSHEAEKEYAHCAHEQVLHFDSFRSQEAEEEHAHCADEQVLHFDV